MDRGSRSRDRPELCANPRVRVLRHDNPRGVSTARNAGADAASGAWIGFLDDDDLWAPTKLSRQVGAGETNGTRWGYAGVVHVNREGELLGGQPPPTPHELLRDLSRRNLMPAGSSNVILHTELFRSTGGFDTGLRHLADWDLWLRLARDSPPSCVPEPLVAYRLHPTQATLDPSGMIAEGRVLRARYGVDLNSVRRWLAWSHLRRGHRGRASLGYIRAAIAGDLTSIGRAAVVALHPAPDRSGWRAPTPEDERWSNEASAWLRGVVDPV